MTDQQPEVPWGEPAPEERASYERYEAAAGDRYYNVPARSPEMRAEYDRQEVAEREMARPRNGISTSTATTSRTRPRTATTAWTPAPMTHRSRPGNGQSARPTPKLAKPSTRAWRQASDRQP